MCISFQRKSLRDLIRPSFFSLLTHGYFMLIDYLCQCFSLAQKPSNIALKINCLDVVSQHLIQSFSVNHLLLKSAIENTLIFVTNSFLSLASIIHHFSTQLVFGIIRVTLIEKSSRLKLCCGSITQDGLKSLNDAMKLTKMHVFSREKSKINIKLISALFASFAASF